jgi:hypothetical protein
MKEKDTPMETITNLKGKQMPDDERVMDFKGMPLSTHLFTVSSVHPDYGTAHWMFLQMAYEAQRLETIEQEVLKKSKWTPTPANVNALPEPIRKYIHDLETLCDPAGIVAENTLLKDRERQLLIKLQEHTMTDHHLPLCTICKTPLPDVQCPTLFFLPMYEDKVVNTDETDDYACMPVCEKCYCEHDHLWGKDDGI